MLVGATACILYACVFFLVTPPMYGQSFLQLFFCLASVYGFWFWGQTNQTSFVSLSSVAVQGLWFFMGCVLSILVVSFLSIFSDLSVHLLIDATLTAFSLVAQYLLVKKHLENWLYWFFINIFSSFWFAYSNLWFSAILYLVLAILALKGYQSWQNMLKQPKQKST